MNMEILKLFLSPVIVGIFMLFINRSQKKRDEKEDEKLKLIHEKEQKHACYHNMQTKAIFLLIDSNKLALESLKKLKDENGKHLLNGEVASYHRDVTEFKKNFETFIIEK